MSRLAEWEWWKNLTLDEVNIGRQLAIRWHGAIIGHYDLVSEEVRPLVGKANMSDQSRWREIAEFVHNELEKREDMKNESV